VAAGGATVARGVTGDFGATRGAAGVGVASCGVVGDAWATRGTTGIVEATRGRNPRGTAGAGKGATSGSKPGGTTRAGWQATVVVEPVGGSRVPMVETVEPDSKRKYRLVILGEAASGKLSSSKTTCRETIKRFVERSRQR
jgi:hypothetical protein